jgi:hypothetical protein
MMSSDGPRLAIASERLILPSLLGQKGLLHLVIPGRIAHEVWHSTYTLTERVLFQSVETDPIARTMCLLLHGPHVLLRRVSRETLPLLLGEPDVVLKDEPVTLVWSCRKRKRFRHCSIAKVLALVQIPHYSDAKSMSLRCNSTIHKQMGDFAVRSDVEVHHTYAKEQCNARHMKSRGAVCVWKLFRTLSPFAPFFYRPCRSASSAWAARRPGVPAIPPVGLVPAPEMKSPLTGVRWLANWGVGRRGPT